MQELFNTIPKREGLIVCHREGMHLVAAIFQ